MRSRPKTASNLRRNQLPDLTAPAEVARTAPSMSRSTERKTEMSYLSMTIPNPAHVGLKIPANVGECVRYLTHNVNRYSNLKDKEDKLMALCLALFVVCHGNDLDPPTRDDDDDE